MRTRHANPYGDYHGACRCIDFVVGPGADPHEIAVRAEAAIPGLRLFHRGDNEVNGCVHTSLRPSGHRYVCICLYDHECTDSTCACGSGPVNQRPAPALTDEQCALICAAAGEITGADLLDGPFFHLDEDTAARVLSDLLFGNSDPPFRDGPAWHHAPVAAVPQEDDHGNGLAEAATAADPVAAMGLDEIKVTLRAMLRVSAALLKKLDMEEP